MVGLFLVALFPIHDFHAAKLGRLECNLCHTSVTAGSVVLKRPGHEQCKLCHAAAFSGQPVAAFCGVCHKSATNPRRGDLQPFPPEPDRVLADFSHSKHMDPKARLSPETLFRADCSFCHVFRSGAAEPRRPGHTECAACHSKPGMKAELTRFLRTSGCRGCHSPEESIRPATPVLVSQTTRPRDFRAQGFSHQVHFRAKRDTGMDCITCHNTIPESSSLVTAGLPATTNCLPCHVTARPASHTARWQDDIHGKYAALDRTECATCHTADYCSRCHNELPRTHVPLPLFKNGGHARLALLNERACLTCHTFQNTCSECHAQSLRP